MINWRGDGDIMDGFVDGLAKYQIDYSNYFHGYTLYGPGIEAGGELLKTLELAKSAAERAEKTK